MMKVLERHWEEYIGCHADLIYTTNGKIIRYWKMGQGNPGELWKERALPLSEKMAELFPETSKK